MVTNEQTGKYTKTGEVGKCGLCDEQGNEIIPFIYDWITPIAPGNTSKFYVKRNGGLGVVKNGKEIIPCIYDDLEMINNCNVLKAERDGLYGLVCSDCGKVNLLCMHNCVDIKPGDKTPKIEYGGGYYEFNVCDYCGKTKVEEKD